MKRLARFAVGLVAALVLILPGSRPAVSAPGAANVAPTGSGTSTGQPARTLAPSPKASLSSSASTPALATAAIAGASVTLTAAGFSPIVITTTIGTQVVWHNATAAAQILVSGETNRLYLPVVMRGSSGHASAAANPAEPAAPLSASGLFSVTIPPGGTFSFTFPGPGTFGYYLLHAPQFSGHVVGYVPDPASIAPPVDPGVATNLCAATQFLYNGSALVQTGVVSGTVDCRRAAVLRGKVLTRAGSPLPDVAITILNHPEFGQTFSRADGMFDLAVNGGAQLTIQYGKTGYLTAQRAVSVPWQDYVPVPDVALIAPDANVTAIDLTAATPIQIARGSLISDGDGVRQETLFFAQGTTAFITLTNGTTQMLTGLHVRATEYTVGPNGPAAMPAGLPPTSGYTYATEFSADEATSLGASGPTFSKPVISYHENFLHFPAGTAVPVGYYDPKSGAWIPSANGLVVKILSISGGLANLDVDGSNVPATGPEYAALGISGAELAELASLYSTGQSLWRVPLNHFSGWDSNWGIFPPLNAILPFVKLISDLLGIPCDRNCGTSIAVQTQVLGERIGVAGTPFSLNYQSDRVPGRKATYTLAIPLSDATLPNTVKRIDLTVSIAGRRFLQSFPGQPNQGTTFTWDGQDAYGRTLQGQQQATVDIGYVYDGVYESNPKFGYHGNGTIITGAPARTELTLHEIQQVPIGLTVDARGLGLGGWTLSVHHFYDPLGHVLYQGDGTRRNVQTVNDVIDTFGGHANPAFGGDGGPVKDAFFATPYGVAVGPDGSVYVADTGNSRVRKIAPNGIVTPFAGNGTNCTPFGYGLNKCGSGGPATQASLDSPTRISVGPDGSVYIGVAAPIIWKVAPNGIATIIAGGAFAGFSGDGGPATQAQLSNFPRPFIAPDGSLYDVETNNNRIRRITPDGIITTVVGSSTHAFGGDGGPASQALINNPGDLAIAADGTIYFEDMDNLRIRKISPSGLITTTAGNGAFDDHGDGGPATQAGFVMRDAHPQFSGSLTIGPDGSLYVVSFVGFGAGRVRRIGPDGVVTGVAGEAGVFTLGYTGDGGPAAAAQLLLSALALAPDGSIYTVGGLIPDESRIRKIGPNLPGFTTAAITIPSAGGNELYVFDQYGRHLRTVDTLTGANLYVFGYDGAGRLVTVTDGDGNITTIQRNGAGTATAIVGPFGQQTGLQYDGNGYLSQVTDPLSHAYQFSYTAGGLLTGETDPRGNAKTFTYDTMGRLTQDADPAGGSQTLGRAGLAAGWAVTRTTALNRASTYDVQVLPDGGLMFTDTLPNLLHSLRSEKPDGTHSRSLPDGTFERWTLAGDPRWKMQAPLVVSGSLATPGGIDLSYAFSRTVSQTNPLDPLSLTALTDTLNLNGRVFVGTYNVGSRAFTDTSPAGRQSLATTDALSRLTSFQLANLLPFAYSYDAHGRLQTATVGGARTFTLSYNPAGYLATLADPLGRSQGWGYDAAGRVISQTLTDGRVIGYGYDAHGNLTSLTPPGQPAHAFGYNAVNLTAVYTPPVAFAGNNVTQYLYNVDRQLRQIIRPDGATVSLGFDSAGRTSQITITRGVYAYAYDGTTGHLKTITAPDGGALSISYDGFLPTGQSWTGAVTGSVASGYDNNLRVISQSVNAGNVITFSYDADSLLKQAGALTLTPDAQNGLLDGTTLGVVTDAWRYDGFGEPISYTAAITGTPVFARQYAYDKLGRISVLTETIGTTDVFSYTYDLAGRLAAVVKNGAPYSTYAYDSNSNRLSYNGPLGAIAGAYDAQDRLAHDGTYSYTYTANGELLAKTNGVLTTTYQSDELGNLIHVTLPSSTAIDYVVDGANRRIGKKVNGALAQAFLYQNRLNPVAELDGSGNLVSRFVYASRANVPDYLIKGGVTYRIIADQLGSPRLVLNTATGAIAQRMDYDEFGNVISDTSPGFQPFGFAGGLYDPATGLVRFGARDYDARAGRWTAKDPALFAGGDTNLYAYVLNDPVNLADVDGTQTGRFRSPSARQNRSRRGRGPGQSLGNQDPSQNNVFNCDPPQEANDPLMGLPPPPPFPDDPEDPLMGLLPPPPFPYDDPLPDPPGDDILGDPGFGLPISDIPMPPPGLDLPGKLSNPYDWPTLPIDPFNNELW